MTKPTQLLKNLLAAGSITAAAIALGFVPFNMGGCSPTQIASMVQSGGKVGGKVVHAANLGPKDEPILGQNVAIQVTNRYPVSNDDSLNRYVTLVGMTVASASPRSDLRFNFGVLDTDEVNAFSGPGGWVMVTRGAVQRMQDESELAGVLAHEVGHIVKKHGLNAVRGAEFKGVAVEAGNEVAKSNDRLAALGGTSDNLAEIVLNTGFTQPQEFEADAESVKYVINAGYDPSGFLHFLTRMRDQKGSGGSVMSTHPGLGERVQRVSNQVASSGAAGKGATLADRFAANVKKQ